MRTSKLAFGWLALLFVALLAGASSVWAGGRHHAPYHGHGRHSYSHFNWGVNFAYPAPAWGAWSAYPYYPSYYGPAYGPSYGGAISLGYGSGGHGGSWGIGLTLPLFSGPRYAPPPPAAPMPVPAARFVPVAAQASESCLQVREYQTEVEIGGRLEPAYGDACLQPDGSWKPISGPFPADY